MNKTLLAKVHNQKTFVMRKVILIFLFFLISPNIFACSCSKKVGFLNGARYSDLVILGEIKERQFIIDDGTTLNTESDVNEYFIKNKGKVFFYFEILTVEIVESIRGKVSKGEKITIYGGNANSCWNSLYKLEINRLYVLSLDESYARLPKENSLKNMTYELGVCYNSILELSPNMKNVTGVIRKKKIKTIPYNKLIQKIK